MDDVKIGDVVQLKSGSLPMVVTEHGEDGKVVCRYWNGQGFVTETLPPEALKSSDPIALTSSIKMVQFQSGHGG